MRDAAVEAALLRQLLSLFSMQGRGRQERSGPRRTTVIRKTFVCLIQSHITSANVSKMAVLLGGVFLLVEMSTAIILLPGTVSRTMLLIMAITALLYMVPWDLSVMTSAATATLSTAAATVIVASV